MGEKSLHEQLTELLMENGAAVTKTSIDELIKFIAGRDQQTINHCIRDIEKLGRELVFNWSFGTKVDEVSK